jgi:hypothetical protein
LEGQKFEVFRLDGIDQSSHLLWTGFFSIEVVSVSIQKTFLECNNGLIGVVSLKIGA